MNTGALDTSKARIMETGGDIVLAHATAMRMIAARTLAPAPREPTRHLAVAHEQARRSLERLTVHDAAREVLSTMTNELFSRLTDAHPAPLTAPAGVRRYTYTPRKILRRVLDHALDHLNQIEQWLAWQRAGLVPTPTDGWVPSTVTLPDDRLPLTRPDLDAWLWRIDQAARLVHQRAAGLTEAELDWQPPDGGWALRRVLHHLARSEGLYAAALDEALPEGDPHLQYEEACRRLDEAARAAAGAARDESIVYAGTYGVLQTPDEVVDLVLAIEGELLAGSRPAQRIELGSHREWKESLMNLNEGFVVAINIEAKDGEGQAVAEILEGLVAPTMAEPGVRLFLPYRSPTRERVPFVPYIST